jgi:DNA repair protein RadD
MLTLRPYQQEAIASVYEHLRTRDDNPCVVLPTGSGKTPVMATICRDAVKNWRGRVLILAHVKELLEQSAEKLRLVCPEIPFGIFSASMKKRDTDASVTVAGIQSIYKRACELGPIDLVLVDEAHMIAVDGEGMYRQFLKDSRTVCPHQRVVGFTATPFRLKSGLICTPDHFLNHVCYEVGVLELIVQGYLSPLITKAGRRKVDTSSVQVRGGEFVPGLLESLMDEPQLVEAACAETIQLAADRTSILIFATGIQHGRHVVDTLHARFGVECGFVTGNTPVPERDQLLKRFKSKELRFLCNVNVLTTGFDAPGVDCVVLLRPTMSPGLYYQMVGRGFRLAPGKQDCLILDFGGNVLRHGPVDAINVEARATGGGKPPAKECPGCQAVIATGYTACPLCGYTFPPPERKKHDAEATNAGILTGQADVQRYEVLDVYYRIHRKKDGGPNAIPTMRVDYQLGLNHWQSEFVCFEHKDFPRQKAETWWQQRSPDPVPDTVQQAVTLALAGALRVTHSVTVRSVPGERFGRIVKYELGDMPEHDADFHSSGASDDEVPF